MIAWYRPILALHVIAIISWMAGILYLYRLLIYASESGQKAGEVQDLLRIMAQRLLKIITVPAMLVSWLAGIAMISLNPALFGQSWFIVKFLSVLGMTAFTMLASKQVRLFREGAPIYKSKTLRYLNEGPTVLMIIIVCMVILKPWLA